ncbi:MAG: hypothetical protein ACRD8U_15845, partial [Pyrinomonadaceae bacterium]
MNKRITRNIALILVVVLSCGSTLSLAASRKDVGKRKTLVYLPSSPRKAPSARKSNRIAAR